jgi:hypothetical protein
VEATMGKSKSPSVPVKANGFVNRGSAVQSCSPAQKAESDSPEGADEEAWRQAIGFVGYEVSDHGRVRRSSTGRILTGRRSCNYLTVCLSVRGVVQQRLIHRLVAEAFLGDIPPRGQVDHVDGNKHNNRLDNLEVVSPGENTIRWWNRGGASKARAADGRFCLRGVA